MMEWNCPESCYVLQRFHYTLPVNVQRHQESIPASNSRTLARQVGTDTIVDHFVKAVPEDICAALVGST